MIKYIIIGFVGALFLTACGGNNSADTNELNEEVENKTAICDDIQNQIYSHMETANVLLSSGNKDASFKEMQIVYGLNKELRDCMN